jgi:rhodanese-related sulfurtransferase
MGNSMRQPLLLLMMISIGSIVAVISAAASAQAAEIQQIKPEELKKLIDSNDPTILVVDAQPKTAYDLGHIKGAVNFPWTIDIKSPGNLPRDKMLILYCDCTHAEDSFNVTIQLANKEESCAPGDDSTDVAQQLMDKFGYKNIKVLEGGWFKWQQLGYPIDKNGPR